MLSLSLDPECPWHLWILIATPAACCLPGHLFLCVHDISFSRLRFFMMPLSLMLPSLLCKSHCYCVPKRTRSVQVLGSVVALGKCSLGAVTCCHNFVFIEYSHDVYIIFLNTLNAYISYVFVVNIYIYRHTHTNIYICMCSVRCDNSIQRYYGWNRVWE